MKKHLSPSLATALAVALLGAGGCKKPPPRPLKFNNEMARTNFELAKAGDAFREALKPYKDEGKPLSGSSLRSPYKDMEKALEEANEKWAEMQAPRKSGSGAILLEKYRSYLDEEEKILKKAERIIKVLDNQIKIAGSPPRDMSADEKHNEIKRLVDEINSIEGKALGSVSEAQKEFAKEHNLELKTAQQMREAKK